MASKRFRNSRDLARSASMAACEKSEIWSFQRLSPRMEANSGDVERLYSHCSASSLFRASRRACRSALGAAPAVAAIRKTAINKDLARIEGPLSWFPLYGG